MTFETLAIIFPYSIALAFVGLLESLLTAQIVDELTDTPSNKNREAKGQGIGNIIAGCFGGISGCADWTIRNQVRGQRQTFHICGRRFPYGIDCALNDVLVKIPMAAFVAVMIMVSIGTFDWSSLKRLKVAPKTDAAVMIVTVIIVLYTHDLSKGVFAGVLLSMIFFSSKISKLTVEKKADITNKKTIYEIRGQIFFASVQDFVSKFDVNDEAETIIIDFSPSKMRDTSAVGAVDKVVLKYHHQGIAVHTGPRSGKLPIA
ncbi:SulP family inorganic anion transporter [Peribacillus muralis]|uniref:SulP family inorganic anion transporter n=1 Tax=Peribacillus muralis TaxID=264697 RepID=UPI003D03C7D4